MRVLGFLLATFFALPAQAEEPGAAPKGAAVADPSASIAALEKAFLITATPEILLSMAAVYQQWPEHCSAEIESYRRFFTACVECAALSYAVERFDGAIERCVADPTEEIRVRDGVSIASGDQPVAGTADATRDEVAALLRRVRTIDAAAVGRMYVTLVELGTTPAAPPLNQLREEAFELMKRVPATPEEVLALVTRIKTVDVGAYEQSLGRLLEAQKNDDQATLDELRIIATELLRTLSRSPNQPVAALSGCRANAQREWGFLTINTTPWSEIYVNGTRHGTTPVSKIELLAGCVAVRALNPVTGRAIIRNVTIRPNKIAILRIDLERGAEALTYQ